MKHIPSPARLACQLLSVLGAITALSPIRAQTPTEQLAPFVTTATRTPAEPQTLGSAVDVISAADLAREQVSSLAGALGSVAGAPLFASGAHGATTSLFLRGANSNQTLFLVDGLRLNDANTDYGVFLGGASAAASDRIEVARGPQSTLYGGEAVGGVVSLRMQRGTAGPSAHALLEGGSFGTRQAAFAAQGERGANAYDVSLQGGHTDNARPNNSFDAVNAAIRLDHTVTERVGVGGTVRWFRGAFGSPGDRFTNDPNNEDRESNLLVTAFAELNLGAAWTAHAMLGGQERRFVSDTPAPNPPYDSPAATDVVTNRRAMFDLQTTFAGIERHRITGGVTVEANHTRNTGFGDIDHQQRLLAFFAQDEFSPAENVFLTAGLRNDDFDTFGRATTGRATAAWLAVPHTLKLRASYGTGFRSPSFLDLYGQDAFYVGNPHLQPERARGWDAGADYYLPANRGTLSATYFNTELTNMITGNFAVFPSTEVNLDRARTSGVEFSAQNTWSAATCTRLSYTYLEADKLLPGQHTRLLRRPRHSGAVDAWHDFGAGVSAGAGVAFVAQRQDIDAQTFATVADADYAVARLYARWQATPRLALKARFENLLNKKYEEVNGYPALGFGAFTGVEWKF